MGNDSKHENIKATQSLEMAILEYGYQPTSAELESVGMTTEECNTLLAAHHTKSHRSKSYTGLL